MNLSAYVRSLRAAPLLGAGAVAFAIAAPQVSAQEVIYACAQPGSGILYLVEEAGVCKSPRHTPLEWSVGSDVASTDAISLNEESLSEPLTRLNGWEDYGADYGSSTVARRGNVVVLEGLVKNGTLGSTVAQLPPGWAPDKKLIFASYSPGGRTRVDVLKDGSVVVVDAINRWVTLSGIVFTVAEE